MPFDKNRKRRLIDACGHERCYSCLFSSEICPLCSPGHPPKKVTGQGRNLIRSKTLGSSHELSERHDNLNGVPPLVPQQPSLRSKVKTNGHLIPYMQIRAESPANHDALDSSAAGKATAVGARVTGLPPERSAPSPMNRTASRNSIATISSPFNRRKGVPSSPVLSPRTGRAMWSSRRGRQPISSHFPAGDTLEKSSIYGNYSTTSKTLSTGNYSGDMMSRLGALLQDDSNSKVPATRNACLMNGHSQESNLSHSSAKSLDANVISSSNASPVSTLTGSSEAEMQAQSLREVHDQSSDSLGSSLSMSLGGRSTSVSPGPYYVTSRRHSLTTLQPGQIEELNLFGKRQSVIRRSARNGTVLGPIDPKVRFAQFRAPMLALKPLFFEVPQQESDPLFTGRAWVFRDLAANLLTDRPDQPSSRGVIISGSTGSGKTAIALQLVDYSCFGRSRPSVTNGEGVYDNPYGYQKTSSGESLYSRSNIGADGVQSLASRLVAYHFCQADNSSTCLVPDFVHSIAAQLCQAPHLLSYRQLLLSDPQLQNLLSLKECIANPHAAFVHGILEPLANLKRPGEEAGFSTCIIIVDGLCEAEYHRPDYGDTIGAFLARHALQFPHWLKLIVTVRTPLQDITQLLPYQHISLDPTAQSEAPNKDLQDYIHFRVNNTAVIRNNITLSGAKSTEGSSGQVGRFAQHLALLSRGSFLHVKLTLDLIERGHLVTKSSSYKVLPVSLSEVFMLNFNLRFGSLRSYERIQPILCVCLANLNPMTLLEIYHSVNALYASDPMTWEDFLQRMKILSGFLVKRSDETYMLFHPSFREWLMRREEGENTKFLCDPRMGHAALALRMSRLEAFLDADKTMELGHHILKAHLYKSCPPDIPVPPRDLQALWVAMSSDDVSASLGCLRNIYSPNVKVSRLLLLGGASPDHITELRGNSPLICLYAQEGMAEMVALLLEFGANCNATTNNGMTALSLAAERGHCDIVRMLVQHGALLGLVDHSEYSALVYAAQQGHLNVVGYLLSCDWPTETFQGELSLAEAAQQALIVACTEGHIQVIEFLLDMAEVRVNLMDSVRGETALTAAASAGHIDVCRILLRRGASVAVANLKDITPLICAVQEGNWEVAEYLLQEVGASVEQPDGCGKTPLMVAASEGHVGVMELLLSKGADVKKTDKEGITALGWACLKGHRHAVHVLLDKGSNVNAADKSGRTPLDLAATCPDSKIVQMLLEKGAILEHVDLHGMRPLDRAISCRNTAAVQVFLRRGAKLGPATWALAAGKYDILLILMGKLLDDGNTLYKKQRLKESAQRYQYALKKFPPAEDYGGPEYHSAFEQLRIHLMLNLARCKRKMGEMDESIRLTSDVLVLKPDSYEALFARAKARRDVGLIDEALFDLNEAVKLAPAGREVRKILVKAKEETEALIRKSTCQTLQTLETSMDTINEHDLSSGIGSSITSSSERG